MRVLAFLSWRVTWVQGSGLRWRLRRILDDDILVSSAFPNGEGLGGTTLRVNLCKERSPIKNLLAPSSGRGRRAKRGGVSIPACENTASRANLRPFGAPPSKGRREKSEMRNECGEAATLIPHFLEPLHLISADFHPRNN